MLPQGPDRRTWARLAFAFLLLMLTTDARSQVVNLQDGHVLMTELTGPWRFHAGDDPRWSESGFDDSAWETLRADKTGSLQVDHSSGFAWYRTHIASTAGAGQLGVAMQPIRGAYEIFINGERIGSLGGMPPRTRLEVAPSQVFEVPGTAIGENKTICIAIRVLSPNSGYAVADPPRIGESAFLWKWHGLQMHDGFWQDGFVSLQVPLELLGVLAGFLLFAFSDSERGYLWYAMFQFFGAASDAYTVYSDGAPVPITASRVFHSLGITLFGFFVLLFVLNLLAVRSGWTYRIALTAALLRVLVGLVTVVDGVPAASRVIYDIAELIFDFCLVYFLVAGVRRRNRDAQLLIVPISLLFLIEAAYVGVDLGERLGAKEAVAIVFLLDFEAQWPFPFNVSAAVQVLFVVSSMVFLVFRFLRVRKVSQLMAAELEAARVVQQVLVPEEIPEVPGFAVEAIYRPAGQVGGDFFQIIPSREGGALIVIGDVSGKGMPAAMTVSLLVGTVRTLAHYTQSPGEILAAMNQRMLARSKDGFTTCMVARVDGDGRVTAANAGHLAPYVDGREVQVQNGLPLGLVAGADYEETGFTLAPGEQLTLMTDGVVEAQSKTRELFGFERAAALATSRVEQIAEAAVAFGQRDDVTVVTVQRAAAATPAPVSLVGLEPSAA